MGIDKGPSVVQNLINQGYVKTTTQGYLFTIQGLEMLFNSIQELYALHEAIDQDVKSNPTEEANGFAEQEPE